MNSERGGRGGRRGRPRPARRGGRQSQKAQRSASPPVAQAVAVTESAKFAAANDLAQLQFVWPQERQHILNVTPSFHSRNSDYQARECWNPLVAASQNGAIEALEYLLNNDADLDSACSSSGLTALAAAASSGKDQAAHYLLARGASVMTHGRGGTTALHTAAGAGNAPLLEAFLEQNGVDINVLDEKDQTPLHLASLGASIDVVNLLLQRGAAITHDKRGFSPLFYAFEKYHQAKRGQHDHGAGQHGHRRKGKNAPATSTASVPSEIVLELASSCPFLYETFRVVYDRDLRETIVRRLGPERILQVLALRLEAQEDTEVFNEILLTLCRTLKNDKSPLLVPDDDHFGQVLQLMVTESNVPTLQSFGSLLTQPFMLPYVSLALVDKVAAALEVSCRMCIFGHQPFGDYAVDFLYHMMPIFLRLALGIAARGGCAETTSALNALGARFDRYWDLLQDCLQDIDFNVQESERFAALMCAFFHHCQVFPLDADVMSHLAPRSDAGSPVMPKLQWFLDKRPVSARFQSFYEARTSSIRHIAEDCEDAFFKYFKHSVRVGGLVTKSHFIQALANRQTVDMKSVSINRFLMSGTDAQSNEAYEFFIQQMMTVPARAYTISLQIDFLHEPGIGEGPLRELIQIVSKRLFSPEPSNRLFRVAPSGSCYHLALIQPDASSHEHLTLHWELAGRLIGLSLTTMFPLGVRLSPPLLSRMLDLPITSLAGFDDDLDRHLQWLRSNPLDGQSLDLRFTATDAVRGEDVALVANGAERPVTDANKDEFVRALMEYRLWGTPADKALTSSFVKGFQDVLPRQAMTMLTPAELGDLLQGSQKLDLDWMRTHLVMYSYGYTIDSPVVNWFWRYMESLSAEKQAQLLQFWSGSPVPPLPGSPYTDPWSITPHLRPITSLPSSATCTRQLSIPRYTSYEMLERKFNTVLELGYIGYSNT